MLEGTAVIWTITTAIIASSPKQGPKLLIHNHQLLPWQRDRRGRAAGAQGQGTWKAAWAQHICW